MNSVDVIIIGGGCAGLTAALYCARASLSVTLFAGNLQDKGGLLVKTSIVENFPGFPDGILGFDLIENMEKQAVKHGAQVLDKAIEKINVSSSGLKSVFDEDGTEYKAKTIIIATGSKPLRLGLPNEDKYWANGISSCAVCDGALFKNKSIIVVGGGDTAMEEALFLTKFSNVTLIHRRDTFRASQVMQKRVIAHPKINIIYDSVISELVGNDKDGLTAIVCKNLKTSLETCLPVDGLFYGLGLKPNTTLFKGILNMDEDGYISKEEQETWSTMTSIQGVFVAGDAHDKVYRQAIVASGDGCKAAMDATLYIQHHS